ncbi:MAG TPA: ROK family protein [Niabella sp.]
MSALADIFAPLKSDFITNNAVLYKTVLLKRDLLSYFIDYDKGTIAELSQATKTSIPKVNETINELISENLVLDHGKVVNVVGRKPNLYGLNPNCAYLLSVEVNRNNLNIAILNFANEIVHIERDIAFLLQNTPACFESLCHQIDLFIEKYAHERHNIVSLGLNLTGRVNHATGNSFSYFDFHNIPLRDVLTKRFGISSYIENDTRAMAFGEYAKGVVADEQNVLFINLDDGIGMGIIINGNLYSGKSGFAGEFGHMPFLNNDIICHCGKKGCLETEASGVALVQQMKEALQQGISSSITGKVDTIEHLKLQHIVNAAKHDDTLAIELLSKAGEKIGKGIAILLNLFNPELVVLGGKISTTGSIILLPVLSAINKFSLNFVNTDTSFKISTLGEDAGLIGTSLLMRNRLLDLT